MKCSASEPAARSIQVGSVVNESLNNGLEAKRRGIIETRSLFKIRVPQRDMMCVDDLYPRHESFAFVRSEELQNLLVQRVWW